MSEEMTMEENLEESVKANAAASAKCATDGGNCDPFNSLQYAQAALASSEALQLVQFMAQDKANKEKDNETR